MHITLRESKRLDMSLRNLAAGVVGTLLLLASVSGCATCPTVPDPSPQAAKGDSTPQRGKQPVDSKSGVGQSAVSSNKTSNGTTPKAGR
jgi:hypothetical protein